MDWQNGNLPPMPYRDIPDPLPLSKVLGPSVILAGLGVGSGEYIIWPFIASTAGLGLLWAAVVSVTIQYFLNMEIERYTLATGETAVAGFVRFWKPWGVLFCLFAILPNMWPGWGTSGVTIFTFLIGGGNVPYITVGMATFLMLLALAVTSNRFSIRKLGRRWQKLHRLVYVAAIGGVVHFWWQVKADTTEPQRWALAVAALLGFRIWWAWRSKPPQTRAPRPA